MQTERWVIGQDPDGTCFLQLNHALKHCGFRMSPSWDTSNLARFSLVSPQGDVLIEAEAPEGLVVTGARALLRRLRVEYDFVEA